MRGADAPGDSATTAPAVAKAEPAKVMPPEKDAQGYLKLGFDHLASYTFAAPPYDASADPKKQPVTGEEQIPASVKAWNGKKAMIVGYMMPVKMEKGLVTEFLLMRNTVACCYGATPNLNEWVIVKMKKGVPPLMDLPVALYGELKVGAILENGYLNGLYELVGERMDQVQG
jgi:hypothetical protein